MSYPAIYDLDGNMLTAGVQDRAVCDAGLITAKRMARDQRRSVILEDSEGASRITPAGHVWRAPKTWPQPDADGEDA